MKRRSETDLCAAHRNENAHSERVALLGLRLFDSVQRHFALPERSRRLLESACRLHDIGYSRDPARHALHGARIVLSEGLAGFSAAQRAVIAGAIKVHSKNAGLNVREFGLAGADAKLALRLGAILRVADAMDRAHVQNVSIGSVSVRPDIVRVRVHSPSYANWTPVANAKADLWKQRFRRGVLFEAIPASASNPMYHGVVRRGDGVMDAAAAIMNLQYRLMRDAEQAFLSGDRQTSVHNVRVAINRFRTALRLFGRRLEGTSAPELRKALSTVRRKIGALRDAQVWAEYLGARLPKAEGAGDGETAQYAAGWQAEMDREIAAFKTFLRDEAYAGVIRAAARFLRVEVPSLPRMDCSPGRTFRSFIAGKVLKEYRKVVRAGRAMGRMNAEGLHDLRQKCKRARYAVEFGLPVLCPSAGDAARAFARLTAALGRLHDADIRLAAPADAVGRTPPRIVRSLKRRRRKAMDQANSAVAEMSSAGFAKLMNRIVRKTGREE